MPSLAIALYYMINKGIQICLPDGNDSGIDDYCLDFPSST